MSEVGLKPNSWNNAVIVAEALARGVRVTTNKNGSGSTVVLQYGDKTNRWRWGGTSLNTKLARLAAKYKEVASRLILNNGVVALENAVFAAGEEARAWAWAESLGTLVIKPHNATHGRDVHVGIRDQHEFKNVFRKVSSRHEYALVEKFHPGTEHRCLVVDNRLVAATRRRPAGVIGDGEHTVAELVASKNLDRGRIHKNIVLGNIELEQLKEQQLDPHAVPRLDQRVYLRSTSNLHTGGDAIDATSEISDKEREFVEQAAQSFPGLRVAGLDVLMPRKLDDGEFPGVIEVNPRPMISMHHFPWAGQKQDAAGAVLDAMFPKTKRNTTEHRF